MKTKNRIFLTTLIAALLSFFAYLLVAGHYKSLAYEADGKYFVSYVIDGDTVALSNGERLRYIGINTPEIRHPIRGLEPYGIEAKKFNEEKVNRRWVRLEFDIEKRDKYGRLLAYVFYDDIFINAELIKSGLAKVMTIPPNTKYHSLLSTLEKKARASHVGIWNKNPR